MCGRCGKSYASRVLSSDGALGKYPQLRARPPTTPEDEAGLKAFLRDGSLRGDANDEEIAFLKRLRFKNRWPTALYYYRELQNLRDPLHFRRPPDGKSRLGKPETKIRRS